MLSCVACETFSREQTKLREIVSSLGTVEAPGDFDFRLRARLADEKRAGAQSFMSGNFFFGLGSAAVVTVLLLIGSALMFLSFRTSPPAPLTAGVAKTGPDQKAATPVASKEAVATSTPGAVGGSQADQRDVIDASVKSTDQPTLKRRNGFRQTELASRQDSNSQSTQRFKQHAGGSIKARSACWSLSNVCFSDRCRVSVTKGFGGRWPRHFANDLPAVG